jgi:hypothetical protein
MARAFPQQSKVFDLVMHRLRLLHYSTRADEAHVDWLRRIGLYHNKTKWHFAASQPPSSIGG